MFFMKYVISILRLTNPRFSLAHLDALRFHFHIGSLLTGSKYSEFKQLIMQVIAAQHYMS